MKIKVEPLFIQPGLIFYSEISSYDSEGRSTYSKFTYFIAVHVVMFEMTVNTYEKYKVLQKKAKQ